MLGSPHSGYARLLLPFLLLLSGFCGISYEILYTRLLGNLLGNQFTINATVLLTFLLGIGWGTLYAHRLARFLWAIEAGIGIYAGSLALAHPWIDDFLYARLPTLSTSMLGCALVALVLLLVPAFLVGCSVPLFAGYLAARHTRHVFAATYGIYNLGAALTVLVLEYFLLRTMGLRAATLLLAGLNLVVAVGVLVATRRVALPAPVDPQSFPRRLLGALALASVASAIFQLVMVRTAEFLLGPFHETFSLVLASVLLGLALGSMVTARWRLSFAGSLLLSLAGLLLILSALPLVMRVFARLYPMMSSSHLQLAGLKLGLLFVLMGLPAVGFGATIPALLRTSTDDVARESGRLLFCSAVANAAGFFLMAAVLHQRLDYGSLLGVIVALTAGAVLLHDGRRQRAAVAALLLAGAALAAQWMVWDEKLLYLSYTSFRSPQALASTRQHMTIADRFKGPEDVFAITVVNGRPSFFINGYISVSLTAVAERVVGALSAMLAPRLDQALVLGMGSGATAGVVVPVFTHTDVVEINHVVLQNLHRMAQYNLNVQHRPNVTIIHDDGIHWVKTTSKQYSLILNTVTSPLYFSSSKLYTSDFFASVTRRLTPDGVYVTWVDGRIGDHGVEIILETLRRAFGRCWLSYLDANYFFLACSNAELRLHQFEAVAANREVRTYLANEYGLPVRLLPYSILATDAFALQGGPAPVNTLDFPVLEFEMARLGRHTALADFKQRLFGQLDLARLKTTLHNGIGWDAAEFAAFATLRLPPDAVMRQLLQSASEEQLGRTAADYDRALLALAAEMDSVQAYHSYGRRLLRARYYTAALRTLSRALELDPTLADVHYDLGRAHEGLGDRESAAAGYAEAFRKDPEDDRARDALVRLGARPATVGGPHRPATSRRAETTRGQAADEP